MMTYRNRQISHGSQQGSVMLVAMVFLILTSLIALTTMNTSILEVKMAGNQQFQEEAIQVAEGASDFIIFNHDNPLKPTLPLNSAKEGEKFCKETATAADCIHKTMYISADIENVLGPATLDYWAFKRSSSSANRSGESSAGSTLHAYYEIFTNYKGSDAGLSDSSLAVGVDKKTLDLSGSSGGSAVSVGDGNDGTGGGIYRML